MNRGLCYLLVRESRGRLRKLRRRFRGWRGVLLATGGIAVFAMILGPQLVLMFAGPTRVETAVTAAVWVRDWGPHVLLLGALSLGLSVGGLYFKPAEIAFLFPAPIPRRELLLYNVLSRLKVQIASGALTSIFVLRFAHLWYAALTAIVLSMVFLQLTAQASGLFFATLSERIARPLRRAGAILALLPVGLVLAWALSASRGELASFALRLVELPGVRELGLLTRPFVEVFLARTFATWLGWTALSLAILGAGIALMLLLDVAFLESALATSRRMQQKIERVRRGGGMVAASPAKKAGLAMPRLPRLGGAGPIAWRQLTELVRHPQSLLGVAFMSVVAIIPIVVMHEAGAPARQKVLIPVALPLLLMFSLFFSFFLSFDFRRDLDRMAFLKALPLSSAGVAAGQLVAGTLLLTVFQLLITGVLAFVAGAAFPARILPFAIPVLFLNWIAVAIDNGLFLLLPYRMAARDPGQFQFAGRLMVVIMIKALALLTVLAAAGMPAALVLSQAPGAYLSASLATSIPLAAAALAATWAVGRLFARFDVSRDLPG